MKNLFGIMLGGGVGAVLRYFITSVYARFSLKFKHIGTLLVNIIGSFMLGYMFVCASNHYSYIYKMIVLGVIASFTTFSSYEFDNLSLLAAQRYKEFFRYSILSCFLCLLFLYFGMILAKFL